MQQTTLIIAIITPFLLLLVASIALLMSVVRQKKIMRLQQQKLREFIDAIQNSNSPLPTPAKPYKQFIYEQVELTQDRFNLLAPRSDIAGIQPSDVPLNQRIVALRYAFLRAEELGTTAIQGSEGYWDIFQQTLEPLLQGPQELHEGSNNEELDTYKKRVENLEKFKKMFFDLEKRWDETQTNAQQHYNELYAMADEMADKERYEYLLGQYNDSYNSMNQHIRSTNAAITGRPIENKTINIVRQDPRAAEEIMKLRNVAADQYRVISNLQRKLEEAVTAEEKDLVIKELEQQLQRQIRFVQESDTCVQLLEEELTKANEKIAMQEGQIDNDHQLEEENLRIKETLHSFTHESKSLLENIEELEKENDQLKNSPQKQNKESNQQPDDHFHTELVELRKEYAELEAKYLELKFK
ncbi:hypothetical protein [Cellvibrio sp. KY-YJ-3]|uniref:hypothetical protein n=1 Tax=Cellvibrio sp. KY-YJ-3 TaxID=454662 RepID=UPI001248804F|nr:hypothetical protein [Cellvibrio sp. KY-YJ-3]QEY12628.1 hypothetical protein D0B88_10430 [Cellvibrio sp. KY-YJ-3]